MAGNEENESGSDMRTILLVCPLMSSPNAIASERAIDEMTREIKLKYTMELREKIKAIRHAFYPKVRDLCTSVFGNSFCRSKDLLEIQKIMEGADLELKKLDRNLGATVRFLPLAIDSEARGEVYRQICDAIRGRIYAEIVERLRGLPNAVNMGERSRVAILELCDKLHSWNILEDPDIEETLKNIRIQIRNNIVAPVMEDLSNQIEELKSRGAYLEV